MRFRRLSVLVASTGVVAAGLMSPAAAGAAATTAAPPPVRTRSMVVLGTLGGPMSYGSMISARGDIIGSSRDAAGDTWSTVWWRGRINPTAIRIVNGGISGINEQRHMAGSVQAGNREKVFLLRHGKMTYKRLPAGAKAGRCFLNNRDQVAFTRMDKDESYHAMVWKSGRLSTLPVPRGIYSQVVDFNNRGQVLGMIRRPGSSVTRAVLWQNGKMIKLGTLGGANSYARDLNERGQVVGDSTTKRHGEHPYLWQRGRMTDLLAHTKATGGRVYALNDKGAAVGVADFGNSSSGVRWQHGRMSRLHIGTSGLPVAINNRGDIAGRTWLPTSTMGVPFVLSHGRLTVYPKPPADIATKVIGIDRHGVIAVEQEIGDYGVRLLRSR
ncbi:putative HAF family extracellular repeat protein [Actinoplanes octamycinicus]|uniref:Putative HAF family extracellular repeat protein n=1 Tax=Actinoplanes octamycinicus TaxID=135948 RepID=A0A7W7H2S2_9ACTN|nr:hypothetical protein [Actinoplanes octamycinicus]MBB4742900.1 putative HAF family extracellular repeat protein [Actinoplanes octamycinicus]GIE58247.1 hypothetical protein Aoc01nite_36490 [Actinoplanes octamycinicus]